MALFFMLMTKLADLKDRRDAMSVPQDCECTDGNPCLQRGCQKCEGVRITRANVAGYEKGFNAAQEYISRPSKEGLDWARAMTAKYSADENDGNIFITIAELAAEFDVARKGGRPKKVVDKAAQ
jgi:hypothetical protein